MNRTRVALVLAATLAISWLLAWAPAQNLPASGSQAAPPAVKPATAEAKGVDSPGVPVQGPSWLNHLGLIVSQTHMGQMGGTESAGSHSKLLLASGTPTLLASLESNVQRFLAALRTKPQQASAILNEKFNATGADLYRWNCQSCHGPDGRGSEALVSAPGIAPEINSVIGPVQGTSPLLTRKRMEARGLDVDDDMAQQVSDMADTSLRDRLKHGGKNMPSFEYLRPDEVEALYGYLEKLSSVPSTKRDGLLVPESASRVGEHIVRGTCHICHDATGPGSGHVALVQGTIPSLASLPKEQSLSGVVHQVHYGSCGMIKTTGGEVMPAYPYLTDEEVASVYFLTYAKRP